MNKKIQLCNKCNSIEMIWFLFLGLRTILTFFYSTVVRLEMRWFFVCIRILYHVKVMTPFSTLFDVFQLYSRRLNRDGNAVTKVLIAREYTRRVPAYGRERSHTHKCFSTGIKIVRLYEQSALLNDDGGYCWVAQCVWWWCCVLR